MAPIDVRAPKKRRREAGEAEAHGPSRPQPNAFIGIVICKCPAAHQHPPANHIIAVPCPGSHVMVPENASVEAIIAAIADTCAPLKTDEVFPVTWSSDDDDDDDADTEVDEPSTSQQTNKENMPPKAE